MHIGIEALRPYNNVVQVEESERTIPPRQMGQESTGIVCVFEQRRKKKACLLSVILPLVFVWLEPNFCWGCNSGQLEGNGQEQRPDISGQTPQGMR
eukprot:3216758-Amphidinium_carterae.1